MRNKLISTRDENKEIINEYIKEESNVNNIKESIFELTNILEDSKVYYIIYNL